MDVHILLKKYLKTLLAFQLRMPKSGNKKVTLSIDSSIYGQFQAYCEQNALMLSKKVELWMSEEMGQYAPQAPRRPRLHVKKEMEDAERKKR